MINIGYMWCLRYYLYSYWYNWVGDNFGYVKFKYYYWYCIIWPIIYLAFLWDDLFACLFDNIFHYTFNWTALFMLEKWLIWISSHIMVQRSLMWLRTYVFINYLDFGDVIRFIIIILFSLIIMIIFIISVISV